MTPNNRFNQQIPTCSKANRLPPRKLTQEELRKILLPGSKPRPALSRRDQRARDHQASKARERSKSNDTGEGERKAENRYHEDDKPLTKYPWPVVEPWTSYKIREKHKFAYKVNTSHPPRSSTESISWNATGSGYKPTNRTPPRQGRVFSFHDFPAEIREIIWTPLLTWNGRAPNLIKALRQDRDLHTEAMALFYKQENTYVLNQRNFWSFVWMPEETIQSIRSLKIEIKDFRRESPGHGRVDVIKPDFATIRRINLRMENVTEFTLQGALGPVSNNILLSWHRYLSGLNDKVRKISIDFRFPPSHKVTPQLNLERKMLKMVNAADKMFGVARKKVKDPGRKAKSRGRSSIRMNNIFLVALCWEAVEGETLMPKSRKNMVCNF